MILSTEEGSLERLGYDDFLFVSSLPPLIVL